MYVSIDKIIFPLHLLERNVKIILLTLTSYNKIVT